MILSRVLAGTVALLCLAVPSAGNECNWRSTPKSCKAASGCEWDRPGKKCMEEGSNAAKTSCKPQPNRAKCQAIKGCSWDRKAKCVEEGSLVKKCTDQRNKAQCKRLKGCAYDMSDKKCKDEGDVVVAKSCGEHKTARRCRADKANDCTFMAGQCVSAGANCSIQRRKGMCDAEAECTWMGGKSGKCMNKSDVAPKEDEPAACASLTGKRQCDKNSKCEFDRKSGKCVDPSKVTPTPPPTPQPTPKPATPQPTSSPTPSPKFAAAAAGEDTCPEGTRPIMTEAACFAAAAEMNIKAEDGRLWAGSQRRGAPPMCSYQSGGDQAPHFNYDLRAQGNKDYTLICTSTPRYLVGTEGEDECPEGSRPIRYEAQCWEAAAALDIKSDPPRTWAGANPNYPTGCSFNRSGDQAPVWNTVEGSNDGTHTVICDTEPRYVEIGEWANGCPEGYRGLANAEHCFEAAAELDIGAESGRTFAGPAPQLPPGCSYQSGGDDAPHWNTNGAGRNDQTYTPICELGESADYCYFIYCEKNADLKGALCRGGECGGGGILNDCRNHWHNNGKHEDRWYKPTEAECGWRGKNVKWTAH